MTLRSHKKLPTTAPMVQVGTTRKSKLCRFISRKSLLGCHLARSASTILFAGAALVVSQSAFAQDSQQEEPARYSPPVHVQPASWSVLEAEPAAPSVGASAAVPAPQASTARGREIANMAHYMRMQNQAVTSAQNAQVNAALNQLQQSRAEIAQMQNAQSQRPVRYEFPRSIPAPAAQNRPTPQTQPLYINPRRDVAKQPAQRQQQVSQRPVQQRPVQQRQVVQQRPALQQPVPRRAIGLQDRISQAIKKTFNRPEPTNEAPRNVAQRIPAETKPKASRQVALVDHLEPAPEPADRESVADPVLPMLVDQAETKRRLTTKTPRRAPAMQQYRPQRSQNDRVVVPSFVEAETDLMPELQLAARQEPIGTGLRRPRVSSHSQPMSYGSAVPKQGQVSVFKNASTQIGQSPQESDDEIQRLRDEIESRRSGSDNELPQRDQPQRDQPQRDQPQRDLPQRTDDSPSLLDMDDEDTAEAARRARSALDTETDAIEDDDPEIDEEDEDNSPPVFDERGCDELRSLLLDKSIRDISLDMSPPASARRSEIGSLSRSWTDASGNVLATGTMMDLRRGYVILDSGQKLPYAKLSEADWSAIAENWLLPSVCSIGQRGSLERNWAPMTVTWHASSLCHKPLYFENIQLERYGHSRGPFMQPVHSAFHFFKSIIFLPYNTGINPPNECQYSLGFYRPGNCAPWLLDPIPFSREGIRRQAITSLGLGFIP